MISAQFGFYLSPAAIAKRPNCYTKEGLILWGNLSIPHCAFLKRIRSFNPAAIKASLDNQNERVMLEVNYGQHWVLADRKMWFRNDYVCIDPWTGKPCAAIGDYHNITGSAHFRKT